jgi:uncharacterized protein
MRKIIVLLITVLCLLSFMSFSVFAETGEYCVEVFDYADLLTDSEEAALMQEGLEYAQDIQGNVIYLTYNDAQGKSAMVYTDDFYDELLFDGTLPCEDGILFAVDMDNREVYINTVGSCINKLSDNSRENIFDETWSYVTSENFYMFLSSSSSLAADVCVNPSVYSDDYTGDVYADTYEDTFSSSFLMPSSVSILISFVLTGVVLLILLKNHNKANIPITASVYVDDSKGLTASNIKSQFVNQYTTVDRNYYAPKSSSSSSSSGSSSHRSSGGVRHGGGGRRF